MIKWEYIHNCPNCGAPVGEWEEELGEIVYHDWWLIYHRCGKCTFVFLNPRPDGPSVEKFYGSEQYRIDVDYNRTARGLDSVGKPSKEEFMLEDVRAIRIVTIIDNADIVPKYHLDVGAALGLLCHKVEITWKCETWGVDPSPTYREIAEQWENVNLAWSLDELPEGKKFDLITCIHTLEHFNDPLKYLIDLREYLTDDGTLVLEVPDGNITKGMSLYHPVIFSREVMADMLIRAGYLNVRVDRMVNLLPDEPPKEIPAMLAIAGLQAAPIEDEAPQGGLD